MWYVFSLLTVARAHRTRLFLLRAGKSRGDAGSGTRAWEERLGLPWRWNSEDGDAGVFVRENVMLGTQSDCVDARNVTEVQLGT